MTSHETRQWMATHLTVTEIERWGGETIRALAALIDGLTQTDKDTP